MSDSEQPHTRSGDPDRQRNWTPRPDPTDLTTAALMREINGLKALLDMRMTSMDDLMEEKFAGVEKQFTLIERQRVEQKIDGERAIAAALQAAKEAVGEQTAASEKSVNKSEGVATKNIDQLGEKFVASFEGLRRDIDAVNHRVTAIESAKVGVMETRQGISTNYGLIIALVGLLLSVGLVVGLTP